MPRSLADLEPTKSVWAVPDMTVVNAGRRSPVPMPPDVFGLSWGFLLAVSEGTCAPVDYPAIALLAACASLIGGKRKVKPYSTSNWSEPCIIWVGAVGDPSARKSPALDTITAPLREIERESAEDHKIAVREWREKDERARVSRRNWQEAVEKAVKDGLLTPEMPEDAADPVRQAHGGTGLWRCGPSGCRTPCSGPRQIYPQEAHEHDKQARLETPWRRK